MIRIRETTRVTIIFDPADKERVLPTLQMYKQKGLRVTEKYNEDLEEEGQGLYELYREIIIDEFKDSKKE